jgi:hypothetical protein
MENTISRSWLLRRMKKAAQIRSVASMLAFVLGLFLAVVFVPAIAPIAMLLVAIVITTAVDVAVTIFLCRRSVVCPFCGESLWKCGTGNFKPRRLTLNPGIDACPSCNTRFSQ